MITDPRAWLELLAAEVSNGPCVFEFCPGPDMPHVQMATCVCCSAAQVARVALAATAPTVTPALRPGLL